MTNVVTKKLPHGAIPFGKLKDTMVKDVVMKLNENIHSLSSQLATAQEAIRALQERR